MKVELHSCHLRAVYFYSNDDSDNSEGCLLESISSIFEDERIIDDEDTS